MSTNTDKIGVIGGGLGGLAAACTLAARGHQVTLFEKNAWLGGKAAVLQEAGFRFDMGPTIVTYPKVLERIFSEAGRNLHDHVEMIRLDPQWRCFFDDATGGGVLDLRQDPAAMRDELRRFAASTHGHNGDGNDKNGSAKLIDADALASDYVRFIDYSQQLHRISDDFFFWKSIGGLRDMFDAKASFNINTLKDVLAMRMGRSVHGTIRHYVDEPRVAQMLDHFTQYVGSSPNASPAILCAIAHMQTDGGVWYPIGGTAAVPAALASLAADLGVDIRTGVGVKRLMMDEDEKRVTGVKLDDGEEIPLAAIVSNMDSVRTHRELIDGDKDTLDLRKRDPEPACSGIVLYLGLKERYDHLAHHDFVFSRDPEEEFEWIYKWGEPAPDPTCYLAAPARTEEEHGCESTAVAPEGGEALYVLVHTPYLRPHHDWSRDGELFQSYRQTILNKLKTTGGMPDLEERIVFEAALTPRDIHDRYRVLNGAIYGLASHGRFMGAFKPGNRVSTPRGLYLAGGAAHPGPGMPMVLMSGWIAGDAVDADWTAAAVK